MRNGCAGASRGYGKRAAQGQAGGGRPARAGPGTAQGSPHHSSGLSPNSLANRRSASRRDALDASSARRRRSVCSRNSRAVRSAPVSRSLTVAVRSPPAGGAACASVESGSHSACTASRPGAQRMGSPTSIGSPHVAQAPGNFAGISRYSRSPIVHRTRKPPCSAALASQSSHSRQNAFASSSGHSGSLTIRVRCAFASAARISSGWTSQFSFA